jgi:hypothetical protein
MDDGSKIFYEVGMHKMRGPNSYYQLEIERPPETLSNNFYGLSVSQFSPLDMKQISGANFAPNINESLSSSFIGVWNFFDSKISMLSNGDYLGKSLEYFAPSSKNYYRHFFVQFNQQLQAQQGFIVSPPAGSRSLFARTNISVTGRIIFVNDNPDSSFTVAAIASGGLLNEQKFKKSIGGYTNSSAVTLLPNNNYFLMFNNNNGISTNTELYNQGPLIGADSCGSTLVKETSVTEVSVKTTPFKWDTIAPLNITQSPLQLTELA